MANDLQLPQQLASANQTLTAQCHCKSVHITITIPTSTLPLPVHICHCQICRNIHGTPCSFHAPLPQGIQPEFISPSSLETSLTGYMHKLAKSERFFCSTCGCHIGDRDLELDSGTGKPKWHIATSIFTPNSESYFQLRSHAFTASSKGDGLYSWLPSVNGRELHTWNPAPDDHEFSIPRAETPEPQFDDQGNQVLLAECHCSGVKFTIPRPTAEEKSDPFLSRFISREDDSKRVACLCVCTDCRLVDGTHVIGWAFAPLKSLQPSIPANFTGFGTLKAYRSSENVLRGFCGKCGATVFYTSDDEKRAPTEEKRVVDIAVGILRAPEGDVAAEKWLTWRTGRLAKMQSGKDYDNSFAESLKKGMEDWGRKKYGKVVEFNIPQDDA
ncbi:Mss4-like protein [Cladorrhinum sp. PSN259]|nr:Mss4-like protein [Cladorrhinum sp. PSN259]